MEDRCVCCGALVPEGRMVCINCSEEVFPRINENAEAESLENAAIKREACFDGVRTERKDAALKK